MSYSNADKKEHGDNARKELGVLLAECQKNESIRNYMSDFRIGKSGYANESQFLAPFLVSFPNGERWIIYTTTSMRSDRIKGQQWDAANIKAIVPSGTKAILSFPDGTEPRDKKSFASLAERYRTKADYSAIDDILSYRQLKNAIESTGRSAIRFTPAKPRVSYIQMMANPALGKSGEDNASALSARNISMEDNGRILDAQGREFEQTVAKAMTSENNLKKWKGLAKTEIGTDYDVFSIIVKYLKLSPDDVASFSASAAREDIGLLPSGGQPKTDVIITAHYTDGSYNNYTVSCKRSARDSVTVHQYSAETFSRILNPEDETLKSLLNAFQSAGSLSAFGNANASALDRALKPYREKLFLWVIGGIDGDGNPDLQWAEYLLVLDSRTNELKMHSVYEYYDYLNESGAHGMFGTPFSWTYPSKQRGKYIQLKCKIV